MQENPFDSMTHDDPSTFPGSASPSDGTATAALETPSTSSAMGMETTDDIVHGIASLYGLDLAHDPVVTGEMTGDPGRPNVIDGTDGNDVIVAGNGDARINGLDGNDVIIGGAGHGTLYGSFGADVLYAGRGDNTLAGFGSAAQPGGHPPPWPFLQDNGPDHFVFDIRASDPDWLGHDQVWDLTPDDHLVFRDLDQHVQSVADLDQLVTVTGQGQHLDITWNDGRGEIEANLQNGLPEQHLGDEYHSMQDVADHFHVDFVGFGGPSDWHFV